MARVDKLSNFLTDVANSIRNKKETTGPILASEFDTEIESISGNEDLTEELATYDSELTEQEDSLSKIRETIAVRMIAGNLPQKAIYFSKWDNGGYPTKAVISGWTSSQLPSYLFYYGGTSYTQVNRHLEEIEIETTEKNCTLMERFCYGLADLKKIILPSTVVSIGSYAFSKCTSLTEFDLSNVTFIDSGAFNGCTNLKKIIMNETSNWRLSYGVFSNTAIEELINNKLFGIGQNAFYNCTKLKKVSVSSPIQQTITNVSYSGFSGCTALVSVALDNFYLNSASVTSTSSGQFYNCTALKAVWLGARTSYDPITRYAFSGCISMQKLYINLPRATVESWANYQYAFSNNAFTTDIIICNDDDDFITKEQFDTIDWETYL